MKTILSTDQVPARNRFKVVRELNRELFGRSDMRQLGPGPFNTRVASASVEALTLHRMETSPVENRILASQRTGGSNADCVNFNIVEAGCIHNEQLGHAGRALPGDMFVADNRFDRQCRFGPDTRFLAVVVPRERLERLVGPSGLYAGVIIPARQSAALLARSFMADLVRAPEAFGPETASRMATAAVEIVAASIAEHMAVDAPQVTRGTLAMQRAKAYVEATYSDPTLDACGLAVAVGVSLRQLYKLFNERGEQVADCIWERRLQAAAQYLSDSHRSHVPIGTVAWRCGFANPAHFSTRFRDRFGVSPSGYREAARAAALVRPD